MKLIINRSYHSDHGKPVEATYAMGYVADKAEYGADDTLGRMRARAEAAECVLGRLVGVLIDNGTLRAEQVEAIFDYDVTAESN